MQQEWWAELARCVPSCVRRLLLAGVCDPALVPVLRARGVAELHVLAEGAVEVPDADSTHAIATVEMEGETFALPFPARYFDGILFVLDEARVERARPWLSGVVSLLGPQGYVIIEAANREYWRGSGPGTDPEAMRLCMESAGLQLYGIHRTVNDADPEWPPDSDYLMLNGQSFHAPDPLARLALLTPRYRFVGTRMDYHPIAHAGALFDAGNARDAYEILSRVPAPYYEDREIAANIHADTLLYLLAMDRNATLTERLKRFAIANEAFYRTIADFPHLHFVYRAHAEYWNRLGRPDMAARLLRSIQHVSPNEEVALQLAGYGTPERRLPPSDEAPEWIPPDRPPRILFVTHPRPHYGLDILYDGLCTVLGPDNVVEYPWKPSLHGKPPAELANYPCVFDRPGAPLALDPLLAVIGNGDFDAILFGDLEHTLRQSTARRIATAGKNTPLFLFDAQDTCDDPRADMAAFLDIDTFAGFFKREMLIGIDYGPNAFPLPFAYPDSRVPAAAPAERRYDLFWAGHRGFGLRRLYLDRIEALTGQTFAFAYAQEDYVRLMQTSRIGLNIFGAGFDTVRYWELPAHGCLLLAERLPIRIPHDFQDGKTAIYFDDMRELEEKLAYCVAHRIAVGAIARAGHAHFLRHHTGSARARQALAWMRQCGAFGRCYIKKA